MASKIGPREMGEFPNFNFEDGTTRGWGGNVSIYDGDSDDGLGSNRYCMSSTGYFNSQAWNTQTRRDPSTSMMGPIDTTKTWTLSYRLRGVSADPNTGNSPRHYLGFAGFDEDGTFVRLANCGGIGNTTLSRPLNNGDSYVYMTSSSGWYTGADVTNNAYYFRNIAFYPPTHPRYSTPYTYTRVGSQFNAVGGSEVHYSAMTQMPEGDWRATICDRNNNPKTFYYSEPYALPAGTPIHRGVAGGTYNYTFSYVTYTAGQDWQTKQATFTGESRNSGQPFRYGVKYISAMILHNYPGNFGSNSVTHWDRMLFIQNDDNRYNLD